MVLNREELALLLLALLCGVLRLYETSIYSSHNVKRKKKK